MLPSSNPLLIKSESSLSGNGSSDIGLPALNLSIAFPQATPASIFPPLVSDYYHVLDDLFTPEERSIGKKVREVMEKDVAPIMVEYWEKADYPFHVLPKLASLNVAGGTIEGYGCPSLSNGAFALVALEMARVDASLATSFLVHSLSIFTIASLGSEEQKMKYLPSLSRLDTIACFGGTEPNSGSDIGSMSTTATQVEGGWLLSGQKRWVGNSTFADILLIFARNTATNQINGFIVKKGAQGLKATKIENKVGFRILQNGDILLQNVFVPDEDKLPFFNSFLDFVTVIGKSRAMVSWMSIGISVGVFDMCHRYLKERKQFGAPLTAFQINQEKLVRMLGNIQAMLLIGWRLFKLYECAKMTVGHASMAKAWITSKSRETVSLGRELLGGNGIVADFHVGKAFCDLESVHTYEGTYDLNSLVVGREITGVASFKPYILAKKSRL